MNSRRPNIQEPSANSAQCFVDAPSNVFNLILGIRPEEPFKLTCKIAQKVFEQNRDEFSSCMQKHYASLLQVRSPLRQ